MNWKQVRETVAAIASRVNHKWVAWGIAVILGLILAWVQGKPRPELPPMPDEPIIEHSFGWQEDPDAVERVAKANRFPEFAATPAGQAVMADPPENVALWHHVERAWAKYPGRDDRPYPAENQKDVGCCVGCGTKHAADATHAVEINDGIWHGEWHPLSIEAIYAAGRVEVGKGEIRGDGSIGAWSAKASTDHGFAPMHEIGGHDLRKFDPLRARAWGRSGVPAPVKVEQARHKMGNAARIRSWDECKRALSQGYAIFLCSNVGFEGKKDQDGFIRASGTWPHCMALLGYQTGRREGGLILNSWGPQMHQGAPGWGDPPAGSFWADGSTIDRMCRSGDCWCLSAFQGFPARRLNWFVSHPPRRFDLFAPFASR